ncbi:unnamed protein product [Microthlaspi erraticum]|uniref:Replication protein A 70 kDa DNA-binding subunit B/D first OB fold domain-containing protein n=1 Tax=Microthlaspi erraticum TaxID=1685480 RepID=A0A6D2LNR6_9BRAS|nr:unnamed protein product [Microthlaspi erraticum]CAA7035444.1 unnamed protein product [Microthlaspi erraticum]CAA7061696.1 unnamed protein product [Microthlaspi erraticum]
MANYQRIDALRTSRTDWRIRAFVVKRWEETIPGADVFLHYILTDESNRKIHASVKREYFNPSFKRNLHEGEWKEIEDFVVVRKVSPFRFSEYHLEMVLVENTKIRPVENDNPPKYMKFKKLQDVFLGDICTAYPVGEHQLVGIEGPSRFEVDVDIPEVKQLRETILAKIRNEYDDESSEDS